jgi:hypothetical protein
MKKLFLGERVCFPVSNSFICISLIFLVIVLGMPKAASGYNATACAKKKCTGCSQPYPAKACLSGQPPVMDCVCYTEFTIQFPQTVHLSVTNINKDCGGGRSGFFIIRNPDWTEAYDYNMGGAAFGWSSDETIAPGTYWLEPSAQWGGTYCVEYFSGPPDCSADLSITNGDFGDVDIGDCSGWRTVTFENNGNMQFTITGILSGNPVFELDTSGTPGTLDPGDEFTFKVKFCASGSLSSDTPYSEFITVNYSCNSTSYTEQVAISGTAHVPRGKLSVNSSLNVGEADWTLSAPGNQTEASLRINNVGDASMSVTVTIVNDGGGVFTLPLGGNVGTINGGNHKSCVVRAEVSSETTYTGSLRVVATYPGAGSDEEIVTMHAVGHHPVPKLVLLTNEINYHEVERDYTFIQAIRIRNGGDANLTFDIEKVDDTDLDHDHFQLETGSFGPLTPGNTEYIEMKFSPLANGDKEVEVVVTNSNDLTWVPATVRLYGMGVDPKALSTMLVIDRSGSMDGSAGDVRKIEAANDAGKLYVNILQDNWDYLGITRYNESNSTIVPLDRISNNKTDALNNLDDYTHSIGVLYPTGDTGIGGAMQTASDQFDPSISSSDNAQAMIVLTDGKENEHPYISEVLHGITVVYPDLKIFCVGIGDPIETGAGGIEGIETEKLELISNNTGGLFKIIESIQGDTRYDLEAFYFKIYSIAVGRQTALDPTYLVPYTKETKEIARVNIADCDRDADFLILSESFRDSHPYYSIYLKDPKGQVITPSSTIGGIAVHIKEWGNAQLVRVKFPPRSEADTYSGEWKLFIKPEPMVVESRKVPPKKKSTSRTATYDTIEDYAVTLAYNFYPVGFAVSVGSDYRMKASVTKAKVYKNQPINLGAELTEAWWPAPNGSVTVDVRKPNGSRETKIMYDDGLHEDGAARDGKFGLVYRSTYQTGYYEFLFRGTGYTERGYKVKREELLSKHVAPFFGGIFDDGLPGFRRLGVSFHVGATYPLGDMDSLNDSNIHVRADTSYWLVKKRLQLMLMIGFSQFTAEWNAGIEHPYWLNFSANIKMVTNAISGTGLRLYLQGGPGYYRSKKGSYDLGFNIGAGWQIPISSPFSLEFGLDYHQLKNEERNRFLTFQLGAIFR